MAATSSFGPCQRSGQRWSHRASCQLLFGDAGPTPDSSWSDRRAPSAWLLWLLGSGFLFSLGGSGFFRPWRRGLFAAFLAGLAGAAADAVIHGHSSGAHGTGTDQQPSRRICPAPDARISVILTRTVSFWRWPLVRLEECLRRRLTKVDDLVALDLVDNFGLNAAASINQRRADD